VRHLVQQRGCSADDWPARSPRIPPLKDAKGNFRRWWVESGAGRQRRQSRREHNKARQTGGDYHTVRDE